MIYYYIVLLLLNSIHIICITHTSIQQYHIFNFSHIHFSDGGENALIVNILFNACGISNSKLELTLSKACHPNDSSFYFIPFYWSS